jgi:mannose-1-phosphate guanylyltransferase
MHQPQDDRCALILAGGDSFRKVRTARKVTGERGSFELFETSTILQRTLQRVVCVVPPEQTYALVTHRSASFGKPGDEVCRLIVQPENRGTAPAVLYGVLSIRRRNPDANIAIFPSDHCLRSGLISEIAFMMRVRSAFRLVERKPDLIVLLGMVPEYPAANCSWIEPREPVPDAREASAFRIGRFWDCPLLDQAESLVARGCLWNSQVVIGSADALLLLMQDGAPKLYGAFAPTRSMLGTVQEKPVVERVYADLPKVDFQSDVLAVAPQVLAVLPVEQTNWAGVADGERTDETVTADVRRTGGAGG